jgi:SAM-dependent methyltransferase
MKGREFQRLSTGIARRAMALRSTVPSPPPYAIGDLQEVFAHPYFQDGNSATRAAVMQASSQSKFDGENAYPWDNYFEMPLLPWLHQKHVLDLGCFNGGRTVAWSERYGFSSVCGVDVNDAYVMAATSFAALRGCPASFQVGFAESLPVANNTLDAITTFDVFEHVRDVRVALAECWRVLKPDGVLIAVFPSYFQPNEHHLGLVTRLPGLQLVFSGSTLVAAYHQIIAERGVDAEWYQRHSPALEPWERGNTLNGITFHRFRRELKRQAWVTVSVSHKPIGAVGRNSQRIPGLKWLAPLLRPLTYLPGAQEVFLHRIAVILQKSS